MVPRQRPSETSTRRRFLRTAAGTLATGVAAGTSGCLSALPPLGQEQSYGRLEVPPPDDPSYRRWLPAPSTFEHDRSHYTFLYTRPSKIDGGEPEEFIFRQAATKTRVDYFGIGYRDFDFLLDVDFGTVIEADFEPSAVTATLTDSGYDPEGSYGEYELFARSDVPRRAAVGDGAIVWSSSRVHDAPDVRALIDAESGGRRRYHEGSDSFSRLTEAIGASRMIIGGPEFGDPTDRAELGADGFRFDDDAVYQVIELLFPEGAAPTTERLEREFRDAYWMSEEAEVFDVQVDGRSGSIETRIPRKRSGEVTVMNDPPQVTWGADFDADARAVTLRHEAGEAVDTEWLWFDAETGARPGMIEKEPLWTDERRVGPGDADTVDLSDRPDVTGASMVLARGECCAFRTLFDYELGGER